MVRRLAFVGFIVAVILGCGGDNYDLVPVGDHGPGDFGTPAAPPVAPSAPVAAPVLADGPVDPKVVDAYVVSCDHIFPANIDPQFAENDPSNECTWREFDQNCAPDAFGCWSKGEACRDACHQPCTDCQEACAGTCDGCKAACNGDAACVRTCAESRARCRTSCVTAHDACTGGAACASIESECDAAGEKQKAEKCPKCGEIEQCVTEGWNNTGADPTAACKAKFPGTAEECWTWCGYMQ